MAKELIKHFSEYRSQDLSVLQQLDMRFSADERVHRFVLQYVDVDSSDFGARFETGLETADHLLDHVPEVGRVLVDLV